MRGREGVRRRKGLKRASVRIVLILLFFAIILRGMWFYAVIEGDEGFLGYTGWLIANGLLSREGMNDNKLIVHFFYAASIALFGNTIIPIRLINTLLFLISIPFFYALANRLFVHRTAFVATLLYILGMNIPSWEGPLGMTESLATPAAVLAGYSLVQSRVSKHHLHSALSILFSFIATLIRPTMGFLFIVILADHLLEARISGGVRWIRTLILSGITIASVAAATAGVIGFLLLSAGVQPGEISQYSKMVLIQYATPFREVQYVGPFGLIFPQGLILLAFLIPGTIYLWKRLGVVSPRLRNLYSLLLVWLLSSLAVSITPPLFGHYLLHLVPPAALVAAFGMAESMRRTRGMLKLGVVGAVVLSLGISFYYQSLQFPHLNSPEILRRWDWTYSRILTYKDQQEIAAFLKKEVSEEGRIMNWGYSWEIPFLSERLRSSTSLTECLDEGIFKPKMDYLKDYLPTSDTPIQERLLWLDNAASGYPFHMKTPVGAYSRENFERLVLGNHPETVEAFLFFPGDSRICEGFDRPIFVDFVKDWTEHEVGGAVIYTRPGNATPPDIP